MWVFFSVYVCLSRCRVAGGNHNLEAHKCLGFQAVATPQNDQSQDWDWDQDWNKGKDIQLHMSEALIIVLELKRFSS